MKNKLFILFSLLFLVNSLINFSNEIPTGKINFNKINNYYDKFCKNISFSNTSYPYLLRGLKYTLLTHPFNLPIN
jgi:hypothetical protein